MTMEPDEIEEFLQGPRTAVLGTVRKDGSPHLTSMWYGKEGDSIVFWAGRDSIKAKNILRDNRVSVLVHTYQEPYKGVRIDGTAQIVESNVREQALAISRRYLGYEPGTKYVDETGSEASILIKVTPRRLYSWDSSRA